MSTTLVNVKGLAELQKFLDQLPAKLEANVMRGALRAGAKVVLAEAQANVPQKTGTLRRGLKISTSNRRGTVRAKVKATGKHAFLAPWMEFGTQAHNISAGKKGGLFFGGQWHKAVRHPGIRPRPFLRPALDSQAGAAVMAVGQHIKRRLATKHGMDTADILLEGDEA